jgi:hypothetical protein
MVKNLAELVIGLEKVNRNLKMSQSILDKIYKLVDLHKSGKLGGEIMPEDENPRLNGSVAQIISILLCPWR